MHLNFNIEFTKILNQFKPKKICKFIHDMELQFKKKLILNFVTYNILIHY